MTLVGKGKFCTKSKLIQALFLTLPCQLSAKLLGFQSEVSPGITDLHVSSSHVEHVLVREFQKDRL